MSYNAGVVKLHNATSSLMRFENINLFFWLHKTLQIGVALLCAFLFMLMVGFELVYDFIKDKEPIL
jgi:hypothetical protein